MSGPNRHGTAELFQSPPGKSVTIAATAASSSTTIPVPAQGGTFAQVKISNAGPNAVMFRLGAGAQVAILASDEMIPVGATVYRNLLGMDTIGLICPAAGTATVSVSGGEGSQ